MRTLALFFALALLAVSAPNPSQTLSGRLRTVLQQYLRDRGAAEDITAASLSVSLKPGDTSILVSAGTMGHGNPETVSPSSLFQIGSNTKAFTSAIVLQLEGEGKLSISDRLGKWLPQYPAWKNVKIHQLLDMTSGITTYDNTTAFQRDYSANPRRYYSPKELIAYVYPKNGRATYHKGWYYSNTGYLLAEMIAEKASGRAYADLLATRIFQPFGLKNTYYNQRGLAAPVHARLVSGYFASNDPDNAGLQPLYKSDVRNYSLSWTHGAGGIIATPEDVSRWARALYTGSVIPQKQRAEMMTLVSNSTGKPISGTGPKDAAGFGLGIAQIYRPELGRFWFYQGETLGYRVLHVWFPNNDVVFTVALNSQPNEKDNRINDLVKNIVGELRKANAF